MKELGGAETGIQGQFIHIPDKSYLPQEEGALPRPCSPHFMRDLTLSPSALAANNLTVVPLSQWPQNQCQVVTEIPEFAECIQKKQG